MTCLEHCKFKENQENARKINRAEALAASGTIEIIENALNSLQISSKPRFGRVSASQNL